VRTRAAQSLGLAFAHVPNKEEAWKDLIRLASDADSDVRWSAAESLGPAFAHVPNKEEAWKDLIRLARTLTAMCDGVLRIDRSAFGHSEKRRSLEGSPTVLCLVRCQRCCEGVQPNTI
jgi:sulfur transfer protein SufE